MFVHLHLHTEYSLLDGAIRLKDLFPKAKEYGYKEIAITDHGNMYGAVNFYEQALRHGIKPIMGCEMYIAPKDRRDKSAKSAKEAAFHLVLLAKDNEGFKNLLRLVTIAHLEGFHYKPRIDIEALREWNKGLIALTACLHGEVPHAVLTGGEKKASSVIERYAKIFGERLYLEIQENGIPEQKTVNETLIALSDKMGIPVVATNDCHYFSKDDSEAHDVLLCIQTNKRIDDEDRMRFSTESLYFTPPEEMIRRFSHCQEAIDATKAIADMCNVEIELGKHHFPRFPISSGKSYDELFEELARQGFKKRLEEKALDIQDKDSEELYKNRLDFEIQVIKEKGFSSYFLIVADFINWAKERGIPVGPGRGSAAGSLAAYSMRITDIDPVRYGLVFERFLNAERVSLPDIDVDFCMARRDEVLEYVAERYGGKDYVAQIATFGSMKARAVIRDVGRALGMKYDDVDKIAKLIPDGVSSLPKAIQEEPRLKEMIENDEAIKKLFSIALSLEGLPRHPSTHAAGVVISDRPIVEYLPLTKGQEGEILTQYDMKYVEKVGLIKFDFLGLKTLTVIDNALTIIKETTGEHIDIARISLDDKKTYELLCSGNTIGVFQLESSGMQDLLRRLRPSAFEDLIAVVALYRPGPMKSGMVDQYIKGKHGEIEVKYPLPELEPILKETYGVIVYQEQVMKIAQVIAGYSLGEGDILRRAMGKKIPEVMEAQRERFVTGAVDRGIDKSKAERLFQLIQEFAGYGFNKSHSACYALIAYQTAWLKAHYPIEFMASLLSNELSNTDGVLKFISDCKEQGIKVLPPDINKCGEGFSVEKDAIRFGLGAVKNLGPSPIACIVKERSKKGDFVDFEDFLRRIDPKKVNKRSIESLIKCGAFDSLGYKRAQLMAALEDAVQFSQMIKKERASGQRSLFDLAQDSASYAMSKNTGQKGGGAGSKKRAISLFKIPDVDEWETMEFLSNEKDALGFYISGHPLDPYMRELKMLTPYDLEKVKGLQDNSDVSVAGIVRSQKVTRTKKGEQMAFVVVEDRVGSIEVIFFPECYREHRAVLSKDVPLWIEGKFKQADDRGDEKVIADKVMPLTEAINKKAKAVLINIRDDKVKMDTFSSLKSLFASHSGQYPVKFSINVNGKGKVMLTLSDDYNVSLSPEFFDKVNNSLGFNAVTLEY